MDRLQKFGRYSMRLINRFTKREERENVDYNFMSTINKESRTISWTIQDLRDCSLETGQYYESPPFCTGFSSEVKWSLRLYPNGRKVAEKVGIFLHSISEPLRSDISLKCHLQVQIISECDDDESPKFYTHMSSNKKSHEKDDELEKSREFGTDEFFISRSLCGIKALVITLNFMVSYLDKETEGSITGFSTSSTLYDDLKEMYKAGKFSDVTLQVGKKNFPAHKAVLAARSKVFSAMFDHEMQETLTNVIPIEDVEPSVMSSVLQYIYTGKIETMNVDEAASMLSVADKYSLEELQKWCVEAILAKLSVENVCKVAILADMHSVPKLKTATNCLFRNYMHDIVKRKEWKKIIRDRPQLASDILESVSSDFITKLKRQ